MQKKFFDETARDSGSKDEFIVKVAHLCSQIDLLKKSGNGLDEFIKSALGGISQALGIIYITRKTNDPDSLSLHTDCIDILYKALRYLISEHAKIKDAESKSNLTSILLSTLNLLRFHNRFKPHSKTASGKDVDLNHELIKKFEAENIFFEDKNSKNSNSNTNNNSNDEEESKREQSNTI